MPTMPYGTWPSPISAADLAAGTITLSAPRISGEAIWWLEGRPSEGGRSAMVRLVEGDTEAQDVVPADFNVRTLVHEYGGGEWCLHGETAYAVNFVDQRLYRIEPGDRHPEPITPRPPQPRSVRYADMFPTPDGSRLYAVRETHPADGGEAVNDLVVIPTDGKHDPVSVFGGTDFVANPRPSPDGTFLYAVAWDHPNMPWDSTRLVRIPLGPDGRATGGQPETILGGEGISVMAPFFDGAGRLHAIADPDGWWNLHRQEPDGSWVNLTEREIEVGGPAWVFGCSQCAPLPGGDIAMAVNSKGTQRLEVLESDYRSRVVDLPFTMYAGGTVRARDTEVVANVAGPHHAACIVSIMTGSGAFRVLRSSSSLDLDASVLPEPRPITFPSADGREAHAFHYRPRNTDLTGMPGEAPPLIVMTHGGPTGAVFGVLSPAIAFWTSRGFAVVDVNYGGSTGYGRGYRELLQDRWGIVDVEDCVAAAAYLANEGEADPARTVIRGGSAGGYTTLQALTTVDAFAAGASYFGVADLGALARETHKFESRYLDGLLGPWPEAQAIYDERSPLNHLDGLSCPVLVLQGLEDEVVPPAQAEMIVEALAAKGIPHRYLAFEGEQHGFRKAESIIAATNAELEFYGEVLGFKPAL